MPKPQKKVRSGKNKVAFIRKSTSEQDDVVNSRELLRANIKIPGFIARGCRSVCFELRLEVTTGHKLEVREPKRRSVDVVAAWHT